MPVGTVSLRTACADLHGVLRGKRVTGDNLDALEFSGQRLPLSALSLDIWGAAVEDSPLIFAAGDGDGQLRCTDRDPVEMPWLEQPTTLVPMWMFTDQGVPFAGDPRHALDRILKQFAKRGWKIRAATEIEFTLVSETEQGLSHSTDRPQQASVDVLDQYAAFFDDVQAGASAMGIALSASETSAGAGQFELQIADGPALRVADDTWLLKPLVRGMARRHALSATFLAQPFAEDAGSGLRTQFWITDKTGKNLFDNGLLTGSALMRQAVAGCLAGMAGATLFLAPFENSFGRLNARRHAPIGAAWGYENRTTALRIPGGAGPSRRIEYRTAGADANPYLVLAAALGTALMGIEDGLEPPAPIQGNAYKQRVLQIPSDWDSAIERTSTSPKMARLFPKDLIELLVRAKRQEQRKLARMSDVSALISLHDLV